MEIKVVFQLLWSHQVGDLNDYGVLFLVFRSQEFAGFQRGSVSATAYNGVFHLHGPYEGAFSQHLITKWFFFPLTQLEFEK